ncbi:MAG: bifunctional 3-(3-hydroxy-phenyl)propionate/3-hydroxycinnamic acid hydroxylase [Burkholderiaceae bacterium]
MFDVAIVGLGPSGAVAAGLLGLKGLKVYVCDAAHEVYDKPRAIALDHEILRVFQQLGLVEAMAPYMEAFTNSEFYGVDGDLIKCMSTVAPPYPLAYPPSLVFSQPPVERLIRQRLCELPCVQVALGQQLIQITQDATAATLTLRSDTGESSTVQARYVIACDGASSTVRGHLGIEFEDLGFDEPWLVVDVLVNDKGLAKLPQVSVQFCEPQRPCTYVIGPKNHRRWEISINPGEDPKQVASPEGTWALLSRWLQPDEATLWRQASYRFHALLAKDWRCGRIFLAGDAAHQQPPFLGQGMCQGIRDVSNLTWKLADVLQQRASDTLLDSYGLERKAHVKELTMRIKGIGQLVGQRDVALARQRDQHLLAQCGGVVQPMPRQNVQPALQGGCLAADGSTAVGTLFPQAWIKQGRDAVRMDQALGCGWRLMLAADAGIGLESMAAAQQRGLALRIVRLNSPDCQETEGVLAQWFVSQRCQAVLVRPDHYVYATLNTQAELAKHLTALTRSFYPLAEAALNSTPHAGEAK